MKKSYLLLVALTVGMTMSSCQKCYECDCPLGSNFNACVDDFNSKDDYDDALNLLEAGCDCTESLKAK